MRLFLLSLIPILWIAPSASSQDLSKGDDIYATYCAQCHGPNLEGGQFPGFLDGMWNYGSYYALHRNNIKFGIVGTQMIAWGEVLSDPQIDAVLNYILEKEKEMGVEPPPPKERSETEHYNLKVEVLAEGLKQPWGIEFIDERTAVFSENIGQLRLMVDGKVLPEPISGTPSPARQSSGQREGFGYMDVALHPRYAENGWIYLCYIHEAPDIPPGKVKRLGRPASFGAEFEITNGSMRKQSMIRDRRTTPKSKITSVREWSLTITRTSISRLAIGAGSWMLKTYPGLKANFTAFTTMVDQWRTTRTILWSAMVPCRRSLPTERAMLKALPCIPKLVRFGPRNTAQWVAMNSMSSVRAPTTAGP